MGELLEFQCLFSDPIYISHIDIYK